MGDQAIPARAYVLTTEECSVFDALPTAVVVFASDVILYANTVALQIFQADSIDQVLGQSVHKFIHPLDQERVIARIRRAETSHIINPPTEFRIYTCQHQVRIIALTSRTLLIDGRIGLIATFLDMTERCAMEKRLRDSDAQFQHLMNTMQDVFYRTDADGITRYVSASVRNILGYSPDEIIGLPAAAFYPDQDDRKELVEIIKKQGYVHDFPGQMRCRDGRIIDISISSTILLDETGQYAGVEGIWRDITQRRALERRLEELASRDELTGIANRRFSLEELEKRLSRYKRHQRDMSVCILDLDHFKRINDQHGHLAGDKVLREFSRVVQNELRSTDHFGRLGGEEFLLICEDSSIENTTSLARRILQKVSDHSVAISSQTSIQITVSIGATAMEAGDSTISTILSRADDALYQAKSEGRNRICWFAEMLLRDEI
ncbi:diguanylate cyclase [Acidithiobacillus sp. AMEEHan]|uniref:sensor domain-containing diguanylate cyclase n=1 Tax=Acidithiobacillus sp. AMEEHan TaxID=2994951 RepID=UPI0027E42174|nr:diguanylate cyclase [Acidithiobacillus sp. AMEEHan]